VRDVAIAAVAIFVCWCAALALAGEPELDNELAPPVYAVGEPIATTTAVPIPHGAAIPTAATAPPPVGVQSPAVVVASADRGQAIQVTPTVPPPTTLPTYSIPHYDQWVALARCESGGDWQINTGNGYYGGLQFSLTSWKGAGGQQYAAYPHMASAAQQMVTAERLLDMQGWGAWPTCSRKVGLR